MFLNDILPVQSTRAQYQALRLAALKLEDEDKISSLSYLSRFNKPGHKVLTRAGYEIKHPDDIPRLKPTERLNMEAIVE